jgi:GNAT superfamily N-acetyltransferase
MPALTIREATEADLPAILALYTTAGIGDHESFTPAEAAAQLAAFRQYPSYRLFVAIADNTIIGTYELLIMPNMAKRGKPSGIVEDVAVDPAHQGQGIGRALMHHALDQCRRAGCYKLVLSSNAKREDAHRFYESLGFQRHGYSFLMELPG